MADRRIAEIALRQHGIVTRRQLLAAGRSSSAISARVERHRLFRIHRGVFALSPYLDAWGERYAAVLAVGGLEPRAHDAATGPPAGAPIADPRAIPGATGVEPSIHRVVLSHWSVLDLHELIDRAPPRGHVTIAGTGGRRVPGIHVHRARTLQAADVEVVAGLPVTTPARTILDTARGASVGQVRRLIREAEYRDLVDFGAIADVVRRNPHHPGSSVVRRADPQTAEARRRQTPIEERVAAIVERLPIAAPQPQLNVAGASGRTYRADFAWPDLRLIVESDGRSSHDRSTSFQSDRDRDADLAAAGWLTLRFTWLQLDQPERVAATIVATALTRTSAA